MRVMNTTKISRMKKKYVLGIPSKRKKKYVYIPRFFLNTDQPQNFFFLNLGAFFEKISP